MTVFDNGRLADRVKQDKRNNPSKKLWNSGFDAGYESALDRYIPADRETERD
jgi:hypothetical protein